MFFPIITSTALLLAHPAASQKAGGGKGGLGGLEALLGGKMPGGFEIPNMTGPMFPADFLSLPGTGKYPAHWFAEPSLPKHTVYAPKNPPANLKTPLLVWGNGGCMNSGISMAPLLLELASHGVTVISNGIAPKDRSAAPPSLMQALANGQTQKENLMGHAIDWAEKQKGNPQWAHLDLTKIAAGGQSCGGMEAAAMALDKRVTTIGMFNSGSSIPGKGGKGGKGKGLAIPNGGVIPNGSAFKVPTFFFLGGPSDMSNAKNNRDYDAMPAGVPAWAGDYESKGHAGTYMVKYAGTYGTLAGHWLKWVFFGDKESADFFKTDKAAAAGWTNLSKKNLDKIPTA